MVGAAPGEKGTLEPAGIEPGRFAEGLDRGGHAHPLGEVDEQIGRPGVDLVVTLGRHHLAVGLLFDLAHRSSSNRRQTSPILAGRPAATDRRTTPRRATALRYPR